MRSAKTSAHVSDEMSATQSWDIKLFYFRARIKKAPSRVDRVDFCFRSGPIFFCTKNEWLKRMHARPLGINQMAISVRNGNEGRTTWPPRKKSIAKGKEESVAGITDQVQQNHSHLKNRIRIRSFCVIAGVHAKAVALTDCVLALAHAEIVACISFPAAKTKRTVWAWQENLT